MEYKTLTKKEKEKVLKIVDKTLKKLSINNYLVYGSFVNRNYFRDLDIAILDRASEDKLEKIANEIERKINIEVDLRKFSDLPEPIKFLAIVKGKIFCSEKVRSKLIRFVHVYSDFNEWLKKWL